MRAERASVLLETAATRRAIRESHQVRLIDRVREGKPAHKWPNSTFGFTGCRMANCAWPGTFRR